MAQTMKTVCPAEEHDKPGRAAPARSGSSSWPDQDLWHVKVETVRASIVV